jgi:hypothetical protein
MSEGQSPGDVIIARAKKHFQAIGLRSIEIPEWGEDPQHPLVVYYHPITLQEHQDFLRESALNGGGEHGAAKAILKKALDADGRRLFDLSHKRWLLTQAYGPVVERLAEALMATNLKPEEPEEPLRKGETPEERAEGN